MSVGVLGGQDGSLGGGRQGVCREEEGGHAGGGEDEGGGGRILLGTCQREGLLTYGRRYWNI